MTLLEIFNSLMLVIKNPIGVCALMGNWDVESHFNSKNMQNCYETQSWNDNTYTEAVDNGTYTEFGVDRIGYGFVQWTSSGRKTGLLNYARSTKSSIGSANMQVNYALYELSTAYKSVLKELQNATNLREASDIACKKYERPADQSEKKLQNRANSGQAIYNQLVNTMEEKPMKDILMAIDAGHGSKTAGKRTPDGYREHLANVKTANFFAQAMTRCGISHIRTGWNDSNAEDDIDADLSVRQKAIKKAGCTHSISFHFNALGDGKSYNSAQGIETLISNTYPGDSNIMATKIQEQLVKGTTQKNRGVKTMSLAMCNCKTMGTKASVLIECGFMTNEYESKLMKSDTFCKECAEEAAKGYCNYVGVKYVEGTKSITPVTPTKPVTPKSTKKIPYSVRVIVKDLKIRSGPGTTYSIKGSIDGGVYTIVELNNTGSWGRLKSGAGWINVSSKYVTKC